MASSLTTQDITGPYEHSYFRYMMDKPVDLTRETHPCHLNHNKPLMIDVETHKKDYTGLRLVQLYQEDWPQAVLFDINHTPFGELYSYIKDIHIVSHLSTMELSVAQNALGITTNPFTKFSDTFLLARRGLYNKIDAFSLDVVAAHIHGTDYYKDYAASLGLTSTQVKSYKKYMQRSFLDTPKSDKKNKPLKEEQLVYAALDVLVMPAIYDALKQYEKEFIIRLDYLFINHCIQYQHNGLPLDLEAWDLHMQQQQDKIVKAQGILPEGFNPRSYVQVRKILYSNESDDTYLAQVMDGSDYVQSGNLAVEQFADDPDYMEYRKSIAAAIRDYRGAMKRIEYLKAYKNQYDRFGVVKGYISPRTMSGRLAGDEVNMLNMPRSLKNLFGYPKDSDKRLIYADYSQLELRMTAAVLNEEAMIHKYENDEDLHTYAGSKLYEKNVEDVSYAERFIGKFFNFSATYGAGVARLCAMLIKQAGIYMSEDEMRPLHRKWKQTFPGIAHWHRRNGRSSTNEDVTLLGRYYKAKMYTDLNAIKMQGSASEVFKLAHLYMMKNDATIRIGAAVHDSFAPLTDKVHAYNQAVVVGCCMVTAWFEVIKNAAYPTLKMPTEVYIGHNWGAIDNDGQYEEKILFSGTYDSYLKIQNIVVNGGIYAHIKEITRDAVEYHITTP